MNFFKNSVAILAIIGAVCSIIFLSSLPVSSQWAGLTLIIVGATAITAITEIVGAILKRVYKFATADILKKPVEAEKRVIYIAHPIAGKPHENLAKICAIYNRITNELPNIIPFVPYAATVLALGDDDPTAREKGISHNMEMFERGIIDEVWVYGTISKGVQQEIRKAKSLNIPVRNFTLFSDVVFNNLS